MTSLELHEIEPTTDGHIIERSLPNSQSDQIATPPDPNSVPFDFEMVLSTDCDEPFKGLTEMLHALPENEQPSTNVVNIINNCIRDLEAAKKHQIEVLKREKDELSLELDELKQENKGLRETVCKLISDKVPPEILRGIAHKTEDLKAIFIHCLSEKTDFKHCI